MTRPQPFPRQVDITRAIKGAQRAGIANPRILIDTTKQTITIVPGAPPGDDNQLNEWDEVCEERPNK